MEQPMKSIICNIDVQWHWTKLKAMGNKSSNDYIFLARDNVKKTKDEKHYLALPISDMEKVVNELLQTNNHLYEILPEN